MQARWFLTSLMLLAVTSGMTLTTNGQQSQRPTRISKLTGLLDEDKVAFGINVDFGNVGNAPLDAIAHASDNDIDLVMYDMEHMPFDVNTMRTYMQFLLDPGAIAKAGNLLVSKSVMARIPAYGRELDKNTWMVKQVLDAGVHGVVFPHIETPEQAFTAIRAMRYPQKPGIRDFEPDGIRGSGNAVAARYWGLSASEYVQQSDIWRLDPNGNLIPWFIIENKLGVENVREIARQLKLKNVGAVLWAGTGDLSASYVGDQAAVAKAVDTVLAAAKEFGLPVAMNGTADLKHRIEQGARIFVGGATPQLRKDAGR
jgi:4-hydroxy-2-oxoheptanedioate aldolase